LINNSGLLIFPTTLSLQGVNEEALCKNHLILGQRLYRDLQGQDFNLVGGGKLRLKTNQVKHLQAALFAMRCTPGS